MKSAVADIDFASRVRASGDDDRFRTREDRKAHRTELTGELEVYLASKSATQWEEELTGLGVPVGVVMSVPDILADEHTQHRGLIADFEDVDGPAATSRWCAPGSDRRQADEGRRPAAGTWSG